MFNDITAMTSLTYNHPHLLIQYSWAWPTSDDRQGEVTELQNLVEHYKGHLHIEVLKVQDPI